MCRRRGAESAGAGGLPEFGLAGGAGARALQSGSVAAARLCRAHPATHAQSKTTVNRFCLCSLCVNIWGCELNQFGRHSITAAMLHILLWEPKTNHPNLRYLNHFVCL